MKDSKSLGLLRKYLKFRVIFINETSVMHEFNEFNWIINYRSRNDLKRSKLRQRENYGVNSTLYWKRS